MPLERKTPRPTFVAARFGSESTLMICKRCPGGTILRRDLKSAIKEAGRKRDLRVVGCSCLDICPKRGVAAIIVPRDRPGHCVVISASADIDAELIDSLLDERVSHSVSR